MANASGQSQKRYLKTAIAAVVPPAAPTVVAFAHWGGRRVRLQLHALIADTPRSCRSRRWHGGSEALGQAADMSLVDHVGQQPALPRSGSRGGAVSAALMSAHKKAPPARQQAGLWFIAAMTYCIDERGATGWLSLEMVTSTRRFMARPEALVLSATGYSLP